MVVGFVSETAGVVACFVSETKDRRMRGGGEGASSEGACGEGASGNGVSGEGASSEDACGEDASGEGVSGEGSSGPTTAPFTAGGGGTLAGEGEKLSCRYGASRGSMRRETATCRPRPVVRR